MAARGAGAAAAAHRIIECTRRERSGSTGSRCCVSARTRSDSAYLCRHRGSAIRTL